LKTNASLLRIELGTCINKLALDAEEGAYLKEELAGHIALEIGKKNGKSVDTTLNAGSRKQEVTK
jgi:hypothetical protein